MDNNGKMLGHVHPTAGRIPATAIVQYMGRSALQQNVCASWPTQIHLQPQVGVYGNGQLVPFANHLAPQQAAPVTILRAPAVTCTSHCPNELFSGRRATCITECRPSCDANAPVIATPFVWNYGNVFSAAPGGPVAQNTTIAVNNHPRVLSNISNFTGAQNAQNLIARGRPILGARNVVLSEMPTRPRIQAQFAPCEIDQRQLKFGGIMQWVNKTRQKEEDASTCNGSEEQQENVPADSSNHGGGKTIVSKHLVWNTSENSLKINNAPIKCRSTSPRNNYSSVNVQNVVHETNTNGDTGGLWNNSTKLHKSRTPSPSPFINEYFLFPTTESSHGGSSNGSDNESRTSYPFGPHTLFPTPESGHGGGSNKSHSDNEKNNETGLSKMGAPSSGNGAPVELIVTNLEQNIDRIEMKKVLLKAFQKHVTVLHLVVFTQSTGGLAALVKVPSQQDAQFAISQLHRQKIGVKRIHIWHSRTVSPHNPQVVRSQVTAILLDAPEHRLPLFKFREIFKSRFLNSISLSDLYRLNDVCKIIESTDGRIISLNRQLSKPISPDSQYDYQETVHPQSQQPGFLVCTLHARVPKSNNAKGWAEQETPALPSVKVELAQFSSRVLSLIHTHNNMLPLASLCDCYKAEFGTLVTDESGVPLEHLVTCISGVEMQVGESLAKFLRAAPKNSQNKNDKNEDGSMNGKISPSLMCLLASFSKELVDLLKNQPRCVLPFSKFIPTYHHHFRRQCRVADYGFIRLIDLFEAVPNVIQVMGEGNKRVLTLTHSSQMRRFTLDLLKVLKMQSSSHVNINELPEMFERYLGKPFDAVDYGLCFIDNLLAQLAENTVTLMFKGGETYIAIPKREQTFDEIERTKIFAQEVIELLGASPQYMIAFERFIPAYHHHFGHQCRVSYFGFTKLIELFEAIPQIVKIIDVNENRQVTLTNEQKVKVLSEQVSELVTSYPTGLPLSALPAAFQRQYGYVLKPSAFNCEDLNELVTELYSTVKLVHRESGPTIIAVDESQLSNFFLRIFRILMESSNGKMVWLQFEKEYTDVYKQSCDLETIRKELNDKVKIKQDKCGVVHIQLASVQLFARDVYRLLYSNGGTLALNSFEALYKRHFDTSVQQTLYGFNNLPTLLQSIPHVVIFRGKGVERILLLNKVLASAGISMPPGFVKSATNVLKTNSAEDVEKSGENDDNSSAMTFSERVASFYDYITDLFSPSKQTLRDSMDTDSDSDLFTTPKKYKEMLAKRMGWNEEEEFVVHLPKFDTPPPMCKSLISPCKTLLPAHPDGPLLFSYLPKSPDPSELPKQFPFRDAVVKGNNSKIAGDLCHTNDAVPDGERRDNESFLSVSDNTSNSASVKRKLRLAAHFDSLLQ